MILFSYMNYDLLYKFSLTWSRSRNFILAPALASAKSFGSLRLQLGNTALLRCLEYLISLNAARIASYTLRALSQMVSSTIWALAEESA